jgi:tRNA A-37 threonylcarbamoyl transferase component Bud32
MSAITAGNGKIHTMPVTHIGRYEIVETLGRGAMGVVYLARDPLIGRKVALKTLRIDLDAEMADEFRERFLREAQAAGRLSHPGIVTIHDVGEDRESGVLYIAMEYIEGRDLKQILASGHRFRPSEAARIVADVAVALDYAHQMGVIHRDVKPANIILTRDGTARIADFGIARLESSNLTMDGQFIGTPNFMSPEQILGRTVDGRSDLFSLGVVLFTLLTGRRPFAGDSMHEVTRKIVEQPCPIPSTVEPEVPAAFNPIVVKCLDKDPARRFQTGTELARVLATLARSLVRREPDDDAGTSIHSPDLETQSGEVMRPVRVPQAAPASPAVVAKRPGPRARIHLPEPLRWEVTPRWTWTIIGGWLALWTAVISIALAQVDAGPFAAPSEGVTRNLHRCVEALTRATAALQADRLDVASSAVRTVLDQAPASPAARALAAEVNRRMEIERTSAATQQRVADLISEGRRLYRAGDYVAASARFSEALELDPQSELAESFLDLIQDRTRQVRTRPRTSTTPRSRDDDIDLSRARLAATQAKPGTARLTVYFQAPINAGAIVVAVDGETVAEIPFDYTRKGFLGIKRDGSGTVKRVLLVPSGTHKVAVTLSDDKRGNLGSKSFNENLPANSDWTLRVDQPDRFADPSFFLVRTSR